MLETDPAKHRASVTSIRHAKIRKRSEEEMVRARDAITLAHHAMENARQLIDEAQVMFRHNYARRERQAEQLAARALTTPPAAVDILLITASPTDVALFRYALNTYGFPRQLSVLRQRSEVEAFVRQAAIAPYFSPPWLIIIDSLIPGMELEDIVAALRAVPAYHDIPIVLFSTLEQEEGERRCMQSGATAFVHKPFVYKRGDLETFATAVVTLMLRWGNKNAREISMNKD